MNYEELKKFKGKQLLQELKSLYLNSAGIIAEDYGNALKIISTDLYPLESHFILELIQNADDNEYEDTVEPTVEFRFSEESVSIEYNETGFTSDDIIAICRLGKSTKKDRKEVAIGEKGIGFKSVYLVSDKPEIHSKEYDFCFDMHFPNPLSALIPHIIDKIDNENNTRLILPYKSIEKRENIEVQSEVLLNKNLLLFLRSIKKIIVEYRDPEKSFTVVKCEKISGAISHTILSTNNLQFKYYAVRRLVDMLDIDEEKRKELTETHITLAFPIDDAGNPKLENCDIFSYLPVQSKGFNFLINSDFILTASREDLNKESSWNKRIVDNLSAAIVTAVLSSKIESPLNMGFLNYLDGTKILDPFFKEVIPKALGKLSSETCVYTASGEWHKPGEVICSDNTGLVPGVITTNEVTEYTGLEYKHDEFVANFDILEKLGCKQFLIDSLINVFKKDEYWNGRNSQFYVALFRGLHVYLIRLGVQRPVMVKLLLPYIRVPVSNQPVPLNPNSSKIYFPLQGFSSIDFARDFLTLDTSFLDHLEVFDRQIIDNLLIEFGIIRPSVESFVKDFIIPFYEGKEWRTSDFEKHKSIINFLAQYIDYIKNIPEFPLLFNQLVDSILIRRDKCLSAQNVLYGKPSSTYIGKAFASHSFQDHFTEDQSNLFISPDYLDDANDKDEIKEKLHFFTTIGCFIYPRIVQDGVVYGLLISPVPSVKEWILQTIDKRWGQYGQLTAHPVHPNITFIEALKRSEVTCSNERNCKLPETYVKNTDTEQLGNDLPFLPFQLSNSDFMGVVGITYALNPPSIIKRLRELRDLEDPDFDQIFYLYRWLDLNWHQGPEVSLNFFQNEDSIYHGKLKKWMPAGDCRYTRRINIDGLNSLLRFKCIRTKNYDKIDKLFKTKLSIPAALSINDWLHVLESLRSLDSSAVQPKQLDNIFKGLDSSLREAENPSGYDLKNKEIFFSDKRRWLCNDNDLFCNDDPELYEIFKDAEGVSFFYAPPELLPSLTNFLRHSEIPTISKAIDRSDPSYSNEWKDEELTKTLNLRWRAIARIYYKELPIYYERNKDEKLYALHESIVNRAEDLSVSMDLNGCKKEVSMECLLRDSPDGEAPVFLLNEKCDDPHFSLAREICGFLGSDDFVSEKIRRILESEQYEKELKNWKIPDLPKEELAALMGKDPRDLLFADDDDETEVEDKPTIPPDGKKEGVPPGDGSRDDQGPKEKDLGDGDDSGETGVEGSSETGRGDRSGGTEERKKGSPQKPGTKKGKGGGKGRSGRGGKPGDFISYIKPSPLNRPDEGDPPENQKKRESIERAAVKLSLEDLEHEYGDDWKIEEMAGNNPGYDIRVSSKSKDVEFYVEVKGSKGEWEKGVEVSRKQFFHSHRHGKNSWLYVVEHALDDKKRELYKIKDPAGLAKKFIFDRGWKLVAVGKKDKEAMKTLEQDALLGKFFSSRDGTAIIIDIKKGKAKYEIYYRTQENKERMETFISLKQVAERLVRGED